MRIPRIYVNQELVLNQPVNVDSSVAHYVSRVLRMKPGREAILFNGRGGEYKAIIAAIDKKSLRFEILSFDEPQLESPLEIELACCVIKNDRMDWLLQKATELGVSCFSPLWSEYTDVKIPQERLAKKCDHWQQVVISACEQSGRTRVPVVNPPQALSKWLACVQSQQKWVLHPYESEAFTGPSNNQPVSVSLLVGPEGGLSENEVALARQHQFCTMSLGPRILRAETAPLVALSIIQHQLGDL